MSSRGGTETPAAVSLVRLGLFATRVGDPLSGAQRRYLRALVDNDKLWNPHNGYLRRTFLDAGLPHDREVCRTLAADVHPGQLALW